MKDFRTLRVWNEAYALARDAYRLTQPFPSTERYGLTSQIRRAAASIPADIAEGCGRDREKELKRFLEFARGSASELETHLLLSCDLEYLSIDSFEDVHSRLTDVQAMLSSLIRKIKRHT